MSVVSREMVGRIGNACVYIETLEGAAPQILVEARATSLQAPALAAIIKSAGMMLRAIEQVRKDQQ